MVDGSESFSKILELRAQRLVANQKQQQLKEDFSITHGILREISLVLDQITRWQETSERIGHSLLRVECYTDTELMQMEARTPKYSPERFPERDKLQRRLFDIEKERRHQQINDEKMQTELHNRLFILLEKHAQLG